MGARKPVIPLTDEQRDFASQHEHLIWDFIWWNKLGFGDPERRNDWYFILAEAYLNAVRDYRGLANFKTFAFVVMANRMKGEFEANNRMKRSGVTVSLYAPIGDNSTLEDLIPDTGDSVEDIVVSQMSAETLWAQMRSTLSSEELEAILLRFRAGSNTDQEKLATKNRAYYEANKEKFKAYYEANKEKIAELGKAYREANKEKIAAYQKAYYEANKGKIAAQGKVRREANRERVNAQRRAHYAASKEKALPEQGFQQRA